MKILVIFTGGTIGSRVTDGWISTDKSTKYLLTEKYIERFGNDVNFETEEPYFLLSENLSAEKLNLLISSIGKALSKDIDGIIVTHGTDTLHFSAAAALLAFSGAPLPIVFVSANYELSNPKSNGHANFEGAVALIKSGVSSGVYISYKNPFGKHFIHSADKALSFSENDDSIYSQNNKPFAVYENEKIEILNKGLEKKGSINSVYCENPNILVITAMPGDNFVYDISKYNAIILRPYHSGTLNTENKNFSEFTKKAKEQGVPIFLANAPFGTTYETVKAYAAMDIIPLPHTTFAYTYMKLWAGISGMDNLKKLF